MGAGKLKHLWVVVKKAVDKDTIVRTCKARSLARSIANEYNINYGKNNTRCVVRKFVSTS